MSKKSLFILMICSMIARPASAPITISHRCESIHRQQYLTTRLKRAVSLLRRMPPQQTRNLLRLEPEDFRHPAIIDTVNTIKKMHTLEPLFESWQELIGFQRIDDPLFAREFTELVFAIQRQLIQPSESDTQRHPSMSGIDALLATDETCYTEAMATRYYHSKRIERSTNILRRIHCDKHLFFEQDGDQQFVPTRFHTFEHPDIVYCIEHMRSQNSLRPLIWLSDSFKKMKCLNDELFIKEFLLLNLAVQHNLGVHNAGERALREETLQEVNAIYRANFHQLPIEQILEGINIVGQELPPIIENLEINNPNMTWKEIWQKNKWTIVGNVAMAGVNFGIWLFQQKQGRPSRA